MTTRHMICALCIGLAAPTLPVHAQGVAATRVVEGAEVAIRGAKVAKATRGLGAIAGALPETEIAELAARCGKVGGLDEVGQILGRKLLNDSQLEDAFLRMAVKNGRLNMAEAEKVFTELAGTPGLRTLARKVNSVSDVQARGHLQEMLIGLRSKERGMEVQEFGKRFDDGVKGAPTDIDVVLSRAGKRLAIESKAYEAEVPMDVVRADSVSLRAFCQSNPGTRPAFCFRNAPSRAIQKELQRREIECVAGDPEEIAAQLERLIGL